MKCSVNDGIVGMCPGLDRAVEDEANSRRKGLTLLVLRDLTPGGGLKVTRTGIVLRSGDLPKTGVILNYCPFCGASIGHQFQPSEEARLV